MYFSNVHDKSRAGRACQAGTQIAQGRRISDSEYLEQVGCVPSGFEARAEAYKFPPRVRKYGENACWTTNRASSSQRDKPTSLRGSKTNALWVQNGLRSLDLLCQPASS
jgi:hypothetical protein